MTRVFNPREHLSSKLHFALINVSSITVNSKANNVGQINKVNAKTNVYKNEPFKKYDELKKFM